MPFLAIGNYFLTVAIALGNQKHHVQLKWFDSIFQFQLIETDRNIYGVLAIDYEMNELLTTRDMV
jgi:lipopolysaccharide transport system ATP-binding protein